MKKQYLTIALLSMLVANSVSFAATNDNFYHCDGQFCYCAESFHGAQFEKVMVAAAVPAMIAGFCYFKGDESLHIIPQAIVAPSRDYPWQYDRTNAVYKCNLNTTDCKVAERISA